MSASLVMTSSTCQQSGKYQCSQHSDSVIYLSNGETFPPCSKYDRHGTAWVRMGSHGEFNKRGAGYLNTEVGNFVKIGEKTLILVIAKMLLAAIEKVLKYFGIDL